MPASPEQLLALLEAPHWKTPGSTGRPLEGPRARATEGSASVNLSVLDHITEGREALAKADRIASKGTTLAIRYAEAIRRAQAIKSQALMGETSTVRTIACPYCGCWSLLLHKGRARCVNRHCSPAPGVQRSWALVDLMMAKPVRCRGVRRSVTPPRDLIDRQAAARFFAPTAHPAEATLIHRMVQLYKLPVWRLPGNRSHLYSLSDLMTAHAVHNRAASPSECAAADKPACSGLGDLFFGAGKHMDRIEVATAKALCDGCPFREPCLDIAMERSDNHQQGVFGGLTSSERRELRRANSSDSPKGQCA